MSTAAQTTAEFCRSRPGISAWLEVVARPGSEPTSRCNPQDAMNLVGLGLATIVREPEWVTVPFVGRFRWAVIQPTTLALRIAGEL